MLKSFVRSFVLAGSLLAVVMAPAPAHAAEFTVKQGETIQKAIDQAVSGDVIVVSPGTYRESLHVDKHNLTLRGVIIEGQRPILEGDGKLNDGLISSSNQFTMSGFLVRNYLGNGVTNQGGDGITLRDIIIDNTGIYGLYPVEAQNILIEYCSVYRTRDAGIYVGQSKTGMVRYNYVTENVAGIEIENSIGITVENNVSFNNVAGILAFVLPGMVKKVGHDNKILNNFVFNNNHVNFADPKSIVAQVPTGTGILILASDRTEVRGNYVANNDTFGIILADHAFISVKEPDLAVDPKPDGNRILENVWINNGTKPAPIVKDIVGRGADVVFTGRGRDNCMTGVEKVTTGLAAAKLPPCPQEDAAGLHAGHGAMGAMATMSAAGATGAKAQAKIETGAKMKVGKGADSVVIVRIKGMTYEPMHVTIKAGQTVRWVNEDTVTHTVTSGTDGVTDKKPFLDSGFMENGGVFEATFKKKGKSVYFCLPHRYQAPMQNASVTVE